MCDSEADKAVQAKTVLVDCKTDKTLPFSLEQIVDDRNRSLYGEVNSKLKLTYQLAPDDGEGWGAQYFPATKSGTVDIAPTDYPQASFAHELLHFKFELEGYQRPDATKYVGSDRTEQANAREWLRDNFVFLYNQLMHYRMYPEFLKLGYRPSEFMRAAPGRIAAIRSEVEYLKKRRNQFPKKLVPPLFYLRAYLALRNLHDDSPEILGLIDEIKEFGASFDEVKEVVDRWIASGKPTVAKYIARLIRLCGFMDVSVGVDATSSVSTNDATRATLD